MACETKGITNTPLPCNPYATRGATTPTETRAEGDAPLGLVTYAITSREYSPSPVSPAKGNFSFPTADECRDGAAAVGGWAWNGREGAVPQIEVYPGLIRLTAPDLNRRERTANRRADEPVIGPVDDGDRASADDRVITGWSRRSRARMVATMAELDLAPLLMSGDDPVMVTLTYPSDWATVAPDGATVKRHLDQFWKRLERAFGGPVRVVWKLEFQRRGAPHFHILMTVPRGVARGEQYAAHEMKLAAWEASGRRGRKPYWRSQVGDGLEFRPWLSVVWADIVGHPDPVERMKHESAGTRVDYSEGDRARDPKRAAVYFGKHGSFAAKDYQHEVPELWKSSGKSVGRFWGYKGLEKVKGAATLEFDAMLMMGRALRKYAARTKVWNPQTRSHEFRPVLSTRIRPRLTILPDGTVKPARDPETGAVVLDDDGVPVPHLRYRKQTVRARRMSGPMGAGFLLVNDGPAMARDLARVVETCGPSGKRPPVGMRGSVRDRITP